MLQEVNESPQEYGLHSLRSGGVSAALQVPGVSGRLVQRRGGWRHIESMQGYVKEGDAALLSVTSGLKWQLIWVSRVKRQLLGSYAFSVAEATAWPNKTMNGCVLCGEGYEREDVTFSIGWVREMENKCLDVIHVVGLCYKSECAWQEQSFAVCLLERTWSVSHPPIPKKSALCGMCMHACMCGVCMCGVRCRDKGKKSVPILHVHVCESMLSIVIIHVCNCGREKKKWTPFETNQPVGEIFVDNSGFFPKGSFSISWIGHPAVNIHQCDRVCMAFKQGSGF